MHQFNHPKIQETPSAPPPPTATANEPNAFAQEKHEQEKTKGEKIFDQTLYTGINWALNVAISLAATVALMETTRGKFLYNKQGDAINHAVKGRFGEAWKECKLGFIEPFKRNSAHVKDFQHEIDIKRLTAMREGTLLKNIGLKESGGHTAFEVFSLCTGGNLLLVPTKLIEDRKPEIVAKLEKKFDGIEEPVDHHFPQKTWGDLITARITALGSVMAIGYILNKPFAALRNFGQGLAHSHLPIQNERAKELSATTIGMFPVECVTSAIAAAELYVISKFKSAFREKKAAEKNGHQELISPENTPPASGAAAPPEYTAREKGEKNTQFTKNLKENTDFSMLVDKSRNAENAAITR